MAETVGRLVRRYRKHAGLIQKELAHGAGVARSWLSLLETDKIAQPNREWLIAIARRLKIDPDILLTAAGYSRVVLPPPEEPTVLELLQRATDAERRRIERGAQAPPTVARSAEELRAIDLGFESLARGYFESQEIPEEEQAELMMRLARAFHRLWRQGFSLDELERIFDRLGDETRRETEQAERKRPANDAS